ncbi:glycosyltransferase family 1 protein [Oryzobacter terrae]|uniref:glycosyltransferase family 1 protein n=1 Tax=Oryzobacter terrae TaxID=1620385 RepID=UPI00366CFF56
MPVIASIPSDHVYVRHLEPLGGGGRVSRLADPLTAGRHEAAPWWPPVMLRPDWVREHADEFDVMHVHFGFDGESPESLQGLVDALRERDRPLVVTVHDLRNPHHDEPELHDAQLGVLVAGADAVVTLTPGAAAEVARRHGRDATVLPHPHVVDEPILSRPRTPHEGFVVGIHVKSLRAGMEPAPVIEEAVAALPSMPGTTLRVDAHTDVMTPGSDRYARPLATRLTALAETGAIDLRVHDFFSDDELWEYLGSLDVSVLPYRFGTHSGWLEACHDLGTTVLAPDCGYYAEQRPCLVYAAPGSGEPAPGTASLGEALLRAHRERPQWRADPAERRAERRALARAHEELYAAVLERRPVCTSS